VSVVRGRGGAGGIAEAALMTDHHDDGPCPCPLCSGPIPEEIVERIMKSAASQGQTMSLEEFRTWLREEREPSRSRG